MYSNITSENGVTLVETGVGGPGGIVVSYKYLLADHFMLSYIFYVNVVYKMTGEL